MTAFEILNPQSKAPLVITCEHASCAIPLEYDDLGLDPEEIREHIGWDIGARQVARHLSRRLDAVAVLGGVSRLLIDCNRDLSDHDLIVAETHGVRVPGNADIDAEERRRRIREFYLPYHEAIDDVMTRRPGALLFSVHSFTPTLNGRERRFDAGVLFDECGTEAERFGNALSAAGLRVRYNQPYSALDGLIFSARDHGQRHAARYLELEINNGLLRERPAAEAVADRVARALGSLLEG